MTRTQMIAGFAAAALLAGCGGKDDAGAPKSQEEVKQEAAQLERPEPGEYRQVIEITKLEVPGMPAQAAQQMKAAMQSAKETTFCLTPADAEKGFRDMFKDIGRGKECSYSTFDVSGGRITAQMDCKAEPGSAEQGSMTMKLAGTVTSQGSDVTVDMDMKGQPAPMPSMTMAMHLTTKRLGECTPS